MIFVFSLKGGSVVGGRIEGFAPASRAASRVSQSACVLPTCCRPWGLGFWDLCSSHAQEGCGRAGSSGMAPCVLGMTAWLCWGTEVAEAGAAPGPAWAARGGARGLHGDFCLPHPEDSSGLHGTGRSLVGTPRHFVFCLSSFLRSWSSRGQVPKVFLKDTYSWEATTSCSSSLTHSTRFFLV